MYYHAIEFLNRTITIGAEIDEAISKFVQELCDGGLAVANFYPLPIETDETHANILLDENGNVIYEDTFMICKDAYKTWAQQQEIATQYKLGKRYNVYLGRYTGQDFFAFVSTNFVEQDLPLAPSLALSNHSPDGFEIGYHGSGPAQLALAILLYETGNPVLSLTHYQQFKEKVIARLEQGKDFAMSGEFVRQWLTNIQYLERIEGKDSVT